MRFTVAVALLSIPIAVMLAATYAGGGRALILALWGAAFMGGVLQGLSCVRLRVLLDRGCRRMGARRINTTR